jgi:hypothetical protein
MSVLVALPKGMIDSKPPHGSPCNKCGICCMSWKCELGRWLFGDTVSRCPALKIVPGGYECGVIHDPRSYDSIRTAIHGEDRMRKSALLITRAGQGCDARVNGESINHAFNSQLDRDDAKRRRAWREARQAWGIT